MTFPLFARRRTTVGLLVAAGLAATGLVTVAAAPRARATPLHRNGADFDGDGRADTATWRPGGGYWSVVNSSNANLSNPTLGGPGDWPVPADYDADGVTDRAVWRPSTGDWTISWSSTQVDTTAKVGGGDDVPVPADYDGDGQDDMAVWRPSTGIWRIVPSTTGVPHTAQWGTGGDWPVPRDYDGDRRADLAVWRPGTGTWFVVNTTGGSWSRQWGAPGDWAVPADYDGDGRADVAVWRPATGVWWVVNSSTGVTSTRQWGEAADQPVPADYDADGHADIAVWRPATGVWWVVNSSTGIPWTRQWGAPGDLPLGDGRQFVPAVSLQSLTLGPADVVVAGSGATSATVPWGRTLHVLARANPAGALDTVRSVTETCPNFDGTASTSSPLVAPQTGNPQLVTIVPDACFYDAHLTARASRAGVVTASVTADLSYSPVVIDATVTVPESASAVDAGITVNPGDGLVIDGSGEIWAGVWFTGTNGPDGWVGWEGNPWVPLPPVAPFSLLGRLGTGPLFLVGSSFEGQPSLAAPARLLLSTNDDIPGNGSGAFTARVQVYRAP